MPLKYEGLLYYIVNAFYLSFSDVSTCLSSSFKNEISGCTSPSAVLTSKSFLGQHVYHEYWHIQPSYVQTVTLYFDKFDIGCDFGTYFSIGTTRYCNTNKPLGNLTYIAVYIELHIPGNALVDGFSARYEIEKYVSQGYEDFKISVGKLFLFLHNGICVRKPVSNVTRWLL